MHHHWMIGTVLKTEQTAMTGQKFKQNKVKIGKAAVNYQHNTLSVRLNPI